MNKIYYLYQHIRLDKNEIFYIGVGTVDNKKGGYVGRYFRAYSKQRKNKIWQNIIHKTEYKVEIIMQSEDRGFIFKKEKEFIKKYGKIYDNTGNLSNFSDGGDGACGFFRSEEDKLNKSISKFPIEKRALAIKMYSEGLTITEVAKKLNSCKKTISNLLKSQGAIKYTYKYLREDGLKFKSESEACRYINCPYGNITLSIKRDGKCKGYKWYLINEAV